MIRRRFAPAALIIFFASTTALSLSVTLRAAEATGMMPATISGLTAQQQQKLSTLEATSGEKADQLLAQIGQIRGKLFDVYGTYSLDADEAARLDRDLNRVQGQLLGLRLSEQRQLRAILSADQFAQLQAAIHGHGDWDGRRARGGDGDHDGDGHHGPFPR